LLSGWIAAVALTGCAFSIPIQPTPPQIERRIAPIETAGPTFAAICKDWDEWDKPAPPVGIFGNTYLVGTCGISAILITDPAGDILIDGGTDKDAALIAANILRLGFRLSDVKYILNSHEHSDHAGGIAELQRLTGAQVVASPAQAAVLARGTASADDPQQGLNPPFPAARVDRIVQDGEQVRVGNTIVRAVATPGHTPGALTWHWGSCEPGGCRQIVYADSLSPISRDDYKFSAHPDYVRAFRASLDKVAALDCDILLTPHPSASDMVDRIAGRAALVNPNGCAAYAADIRKRLDERLAKERAK
jgi:metallo-beta-lactamase class B